MVEYVIAQGAAVPWVGHAVRAALFTAAGVVLIVVGIRRRAARARWDRDDDRRLVHPDGPAPADEDRAPAPPAGGAWVTATGAVLAVLGFVHILDLVATLRVSGVI
ncbi:hypothetical protein L2K20_08245 [Mycobacterium sp. MBM]|nr:hypothetical protein [Mycobacterium sp. MBM]